MALFRFIFSIIFAPIRWFANLLTQRKDNLLEWHLNYGPVSVKIQTNHKEKFLTDDLLIASYILFLARYFYICDDRQTDVVRDSLLDAIEKSQKSDEIAPKLYETVFQTLSQMERDATSGLFITYMSLPIPPLVYSEDKEPSHSFAKYSFLVFVPAGWSGLASIFHMSAGPDIILLPLTVGVLYDYVVNKMRNKDKKEKLDRSILDLLEKHKMVDCRSMAGLRELPIEVIGNNNLNWRK